MIQGEMHAQPARLGHRIDQMTERAFDRQGGVIALGQKQRRHEARVQRLRSAPRSSGAHRPALLTRMRASRSASSPALRTVEAIAIAVARDGGDFRVAHQRGACRFRVAQQRQHILMAVDDAGGGRKQPLRARTVPAPAPRSRACSSGLRSSTPLSRRLTQDAGPACASCPAWVATISLPSRLWPTPWLSQKA